MRDGLQTQSKLYNVKEKYEIYKTIVKKHKPESIEIGSIVNKNILPQLENTIELYKYIESQEYNCCDRPKLYVLTPNTKALEKGLENQIINFSFVTSVSDAFQLKNTKKTMIDTRNLINEMVTLIKNSKNKHKIKLYLSCIDECPLSGKVNLQTIIEEVMYYYSNHKNNIQELCLSDTCGTLTYNRFKIIVNTLLEYYNIEPESLSLHLHVSESNIIQVTNIINYSLSKNINKFDVSYFKNMGGCSVTMESDKINGNLTYTHLYTILENE